MADPVEISVPEFFQGRKRYAADYMRNGPWHWSTTFRIYKTTFDLTLSFLALPTIVFVAAMLLILNPFFNPGPLLFVQDRLGRYRVPFRVYKFRTMTTAPATARTASDGVEHHRITRLGRFMRKMRIDELPNFVNVLRGEMSVIGPRPDALEHAQKYLTEIPHYGYRYLVKPGITGLAQIESGYAEGMEATAIKAHYDQLYVETSCGRLDVYIAWRTMQVVFTGFGAK